MPATLPPPGHYRPERAEEVYRVEYQKLYGEARKYANEHGVQPASRDKRRVALLLVDVQNTFCLPDFELFAAGRSGKGAVEDNQRLSRWIYANLGAITDITATMDTHAAMQIFHSVFLMDENGNPPDPMTILTPDDLESGRWKLNPEVAANLGAGGIPLNDGRPDLNEYADPEKLFEHLKYYTRTLSEKETFDHIIWPYHAMLGGIGHALASIIEEACFFHAAARQSQTRFELKGANPLTEHYSALSAEVRKDSAGRSIAASNPALLDRLLDADALFIAGQAKSHCVAWTIEDLLREIQARDPRLTQRVYLLEDAASAVVVPNGPDFTDAAEKAYARFEQAGMHRISTEQSLAELLE